MSGADYGLWKSVMSADGGEPPPGALRKLSEMYAFCQQAVCRHRALVTYFGQPYDKPSCGACDLCLGDFEEVADAQNVAKKVLSWMSLTKI